MIVIEIIDIKNFMAHLLLKDTFDHFLLFEARAVTASEFLMKGGRRREWYDSDQWSQMCSERGEHDCMHMTWNEMKEIMFHFIQRKEIAAASICGSGSFKQTERADPWRRICSAGR